MELDGLQCQPQIAMLWRQGVCSTCLRRRFERNISSLSSRRNSTRSCRKSSRSQDGSHSQGQGRMSNGRRMATSIIVRSVVFNRRSGLSRRREAVAVVPLLLLLPLLCRCLREQPAAGETPRPSCHCVCLKQVQANVQRMDTVKISSEEGSITSRGGSRITVSVRMMVRFHSASLGKCSGEATY